MNKILNFALPILSSDMHQEKLSLPFEIDAAWAATHQVVAVLTGGTEQMKINTK